MISFIDWIVIGLLLLTSLVVGLYFSRRTAASGVVGYFSANRNLPWWGIGLSNTATYQSGAGGFLMLVLTFGLVGNWIWWASWVIWMPLVAIVWAPLWRRMGINTTAELITLRYGGKASSIARKCYAFISCFGFAVLLIGYITGFFVKTIAPVFDVSVVEVLLVLGGITVIYTMFGGLTGVVYVDVIQFIFLLAGSFLFLYFAIDQSGGLNTLIHRVGDIRPGSLDMVPPTESFGLPLFLILIIQGFMFAGSPTAGEGSTAQRFMAAKSEKHAMAGQLFNAFLALSLRAIPLIGLGLVCMSMFVTKDIASQVNDASGSMVTLKDPVYAWGMLLNSISLPHGLKGLLLATEIAAYMSTLSTIINWGSSFVVNDLLPKRYLNNQKKQVLFSRATALILFFASGIVAAFFVENMVSWFVFINSAMVVFLLPLSWLRFFWWRFNVWGELSALVLGLPISIIVWFVLDYQNKSMWQGLAILVGLSFIVLFVVTLLTPPEKEERLMEFYQRCKPPGWWGPIRKRLSSDIEIDSRTLITKSVLGIFSCLGLVIFTNAIFAGNFILISLGLVIAIIAGFLLVRNLN